MTKNTVLKTHEINKSGQALDIMSGIETVNPEIINEVIEHLPDLSESILTLSDNFNQTIENISSMNSQITRDTLKVRQSLIDSINRQVDNAQTSDEKYSYFLLSKQVVDGTTEFSLKSQELNNKNAEKSTRIALTITSIVGIAFGVYSYFNLKMEKSENRGA